MELLKIIQSNIMHSDFEVLSMMVLIIVLSYFLSILICLLTKCSCLHSVNKFVKAITDFLFSKFSVSFC